MGRLFGNIKGAVKEFRFTYTPTRKSAVSRAILAAVFFLLSVVSIDVVALEEQTSQPSDEDLIQAFNLGFTRGQDSENETTMVVTRFGPTFVFREFGVDTEDKMKLACVLCTPDEALDKALLFGLALNTEKRLAHSDSPAEMDPVSSELVDLATLKKSPISKKLRPTIALVGLGVTAVALGAIFLWLDGQCANNVVDSQGDCQKHHNSKGVGLSLISVGAIIDIGALVWFFWPERNESVEMEESK